jgi:SAM-dependent methyltransferase
VIAATVVSGSAWSQYLRDYHARRPGITEAVLSRSTHPLHGTPYHWVAAPVPAGASVVLDLACGSAPMRGLLPSGATYLGLDVSEPELHVAAQLGRTGLAVADVARLPMADASVDAVTCSMALMLFDRLDHVLAEVARVLRPGGVLSTIRPVGRPFRAGDLRHGLPLVVGLGRGPQLPHRYRSRSLARLLHRHELAPTSDEALRFAFRLEDASAARLAVDALYLPDVSPARRVRAATLLARTSGEGRTLPVSIRRTVATRVATLDARGAR